MCARFARDHAVDFIFFSFWNAKQQHVYHQNGVVYSGGPQHQQSSANL